MNGGNLTVMLRDIMKLRAPTLIFFSAFLIRALCLYGNYSSDPVFSLPSVDSEHHFKEAMYLLSEGWQGPPIPYWKPPFYSYFLAVLFRLFGVNFLFLRFFQIAIGSFNCVLIYFLGKTLFDRRIGILSGFIASIYGMFIYFDLQILVTTFTVAFTLMALISLLQAWKGTPINWLAPGLWIGLTSSTRSEILLFVPFILFWLTGMPRPWLLRMKSAVVLITGICVVVLPISVRNYLITNDSILISSNGGINFFVANNISYDQASGMWLSFPMMWDRVAYAPEYKGITKESQKSSYFYKMAMKNIVMDPSGYLKVLGRKLFLFINSYEISSNRNIYAFVSKIPLLKALLWKSSHFAFPFGLVAPIGLVGFVLAWNDKKKRTSFRLLLYFILASIGSILMFFSTARFRMTIVPIYIIFAAYGFFRLIAYGKQERKKGLILSTILLLMFCFIINGEIAQTSNLPPPDLMHLAIKYEQEQSHQKAEDLFSLILNTDSDNLLVKHFLGRSLYTSRQYGKALSVYQGMLYTSEIDPDWRRYIHEQLALIYRQMGKYETAINEYKIILSMNPDLPIYHGNNFFVIPDEKFLYYRTLFSMSETYHQMGDEEARLDLLRQIEKGGSEMFRKNAADILK